MEDGLYLMRWRLQALGHPDVRKYRRTRSDVMHDNLDWTARRGCRRKRGGRGTIVLQCVREREKRRESMGEMNKRGAFQSVLEPLFEP